MPTSDAKAPPIRLIVEAGPERPHIGPLIPGRWRIGRAPENDVVLIDVAVSRQHAQLCTVGARWQLRDLGSTQGTWLNATRLIEQIDTLLVDGDRLRIGPWLLAVQLDRLVEAPVPASLRRPQTIGSVPQQRLRALFALAHSAHRSDDDDALLESLCRDLGESLTYDRVALLRDEAGAAKVCALYLRDPQAPARAFSSTLMRAAEPDQPALLESIAPGELGASLIANPVAHALCLELSAVAEPTWLYLDRAEPFADSDGSVLAYIEAAARIAALAISHRDGLRAAAERERLRAELDQARAVQQQLCASRSGQIARLSYAFSTEPGAGMCGDFVDVLQAQDGAVWALVGDVVGHGAAAAMLMASALAILRSECRRSQSPAAVADHLASELAAVLARGQFITLWLARIDSAGHVAVVDAGHGQCWHRHATHDLTQPALRGHPPIGVLVNAKHSAETMHLIADEALVVTTDGYGDALGDGATRIAFTRAIATATTPAEIVERIRASVAIERRRDDASVLVLTRN